MNLHFLPTDVRAAIANLNLNFLTEIRLRSGQAVIIEYRGEYTYINASGACDNLKGAIVCANAESVLYSAMERSVYAYQEQLKEGFITVDGGVRIGVAGEYVMSGSECVTIKNITSINVRIPHDVHGIADGVFECIYNGKLHSAVIFSPPDCGKTTMLRDCARKISKEAKLNVLVFDQRGEIYGADGKGGGYDLGACDVVRGCGKYTAFANAIRVMRPQAIVTDELYGADDVSAVRYAAECGIAVVASSHSLDRRVLQKLPFEYFIGLAGIGKDAVIYDKDFNIICHCSTVGSVGSCNIG